jgi:putative phage-type endonuclease
MSNYREVAQGTPEWILARLGCGTASRANDMCAAESTAAYQNYLWELVAERETAQPAESYVNSDMERGTALEPIARAAYEAHTGTFVTQTGFWLHPEIPYFGASPDGLVGDDGLIEIKCPRTSTHLRYRAEGKVPTKYKRQMMCQLVCTGRKWVDFVSFDDRVRQAKQLFVVRFEPKQEEIDEMMEQIKKFLDRVAKECE